MKIPQEEYLNKKKNLIAVGQSLFQRFGYHASSIRIITVNAEMSKGSFYNYFKSKEDFAVACLADYIDNYENLYSLSSKSRTQPISELLTLLLNKRAAFNQSLAEQKKACLIQMFSLELLPWSSKISKVIKKYNKNLKLNIHGLIYRNSNWQLTKPKIKKQLKKVKNELYLKLIELDTIFHGLNVIGKTKDVRDFQKLPLRSLNKWILLNHNDL